MKHVTMLLLLITVLGAALAQPGPSTGQPTVAPATPDNLNALTNTADQVVLAMVTEVGRVTNEAGYPEGRIVLKVDRVLKGMPGATAVVTSLLPPEGVNKDLVFAGQVRVAVGDERVFFLLRARGGYRPLAMYINGVPGAVQPAAVADKVVDSLKAVTVEAAITGVAGPFYFDQPATVTVAVHNTGAAPVQVMPPALKGFFYSPRINSDLNFHAPVDRNAPMKMLLNAVPATPQATTAHLVAVGAADVQVAAPLTLIGPNGGIPIPVMQTLQPGETKTLSVTMQCSKPVTWAVLAADLYLLSPVNLCATVQVALPADNGRRTYNIITPWTDALAGDAPPKEAEALAKGRS